MKTLTLAFLGGLMATAAAAQTTPASPSRPATPAITTPSVSTQPTSPGTSTGASTSPAAASGDSNQAVATTNANAPEPAKGANSFTDGEARRRIEGQGFADVSDLKKDADGIWRGNATKNGAKVGVWLDYKGNIGQN